MTLLPLLKATAKEAGTDVRIVNVRLSEHFVILLINVPRELCPTMHHLGSYRPKRFEVLGAGYGSEIERI